VGDEVVEQDGANGGTGNAPGAGESQQKSGETLFTQAQLEAAIKERLDRERKKSEEAAAKAATEAEQKRLADQQEWQKLAEARAQELAALEPVKAQAERYEAALKAQLEALRKPLPAHILTLLDALDPAAQLEYIAANQEQLVPKQEPQRGGGTPPRGVQRPQAQQNNQQQPQRRRLTL
jgi:hypothetical protein